MTTRRSGRSASVTAPTCRGRASLVPSTPPGRLSASCSRSARSNAASPTPGSLSTRRRWAPSSRQSWRRCSAPPRSPHRSRRSGADRRARWCAQRRSRGLARRAAGARPGRPGGDVVTAIADPRDVVAAVTDPELPQLTLDDLGVLGDVVVAEGVVVVELMPTYTGCPAMDVMRDDVVAALRRAGYDDVDVRVQLTPAWTLRPDQCRRPPQARRRGDRSAGSGAGAGAGDAHPDHRAPRGIPADLPALWLDGHGGDVALRGHGLQVVASLPRVAPSRSSTSRRCDDRRVPSLAVAEITELCGDAVAITFDVPAELAERVRVPPRPMGHAAPVRRRRRASALVLDLRSGRGIAADRRARGARRRGLDVAGARRAAGRPHRSPGTERQLHPRRRRRWPPRADRRRLGDHPGAVDRLVGAPRIRPARSP